MKLKDRDRESWRKGERELDGFMWREERAISYILERERRAIQIMNEREKGGGGVDRDSGKKRVGSGEKEREGERYK